jgi:hypothetical protein
MMRLYRSICIAFIVLIYSLPILSGAERCSVIIPDESSIIGSTRYTPASIKGIFTAQVRNGLTETKAKGKVGELGAVEYFRRNEVFGHVYVNLRNVLEKMGCEIIEDYLKGAGDRGVDDIFVIQTSERTGFRPDFRTRPIFHESKFSSSCKLILPDTKTMCQQMSLEWLKTNMKDIAERATGQVEMCLGTHILKVRSCEKCREDFQAIVRWLQGCIGKQYCYRTASVVCPDGNFILYQIQ